MDFGSDPGSFLALLAVLLVAFLLFDLLVAGGGATGGAASCVGGIAGGIGGMMGGVAGVMGTPWGWGPLLMVVAIVGLLLGAPDLGPGVAVLVILGVAVLVVLALGLAILISRGTGAPTGARRPSSPEELLRERFASGELGRQQYLDALVGMLKDRYVRGEIELGEYETRLELLLQEPVRRWRQESG